MLAIEISQQGGPDVLKPTQREIPVPAAGQVLIKVAAAGVNRPDILQRMGLYPPPSGASDIPGLEIAGTIAALGTNINSFKAGDIVCALVSGGGYAEYCLASEQTCLPIPNNISLIEAAGIPETFFTVWDNIFERGRLSPGETMLVHGGSSGIGTTAIQLAKAFGANVIITAGSAEKCAFCRDLGADLTVNYQNEDFVKIVKDYTHQKGVDVVLDMVGGDYFPRNLKCLAPEGRLVQIAVLNGSKTELDLFSIMLKRLNITGSTLRARPDEFKGKIAQQIKQNIWPLLEKGTIKPIIHSTFALSDAALAHQLMESGQHMGKIILQVQH